jgi:hypothetical protein
MAVQAMPALVILAWAIASGDIGLGYSIRPLLLIPDQETAHLLPAEPAGAGSIGKINFN